MAVRRTGKLIITLLLCLTTSIPAFAQKSKDAEELGKALEYFTSAKYHEALLIFQRLDKEYKLNERFKAYIGLCYYHDWDYEAAVKYLEGVMPKLEVLQSWKPAYDQYMNAEKIYNQYKQEENVQGRLAQIKRMAAACWTNYEATLPKDSLSKIINNTTNKDNKTTQLKNISTIINSLISTMLLPSTTADNVKDIIKKEEKIKLEK